MPDRYLNDASPVDRAGHGDERRPRPLRGAGPEPVGAVAGDQREVRERLDVLHERRAPEEAALRRGAAEHPRAGRSALDVREDGRLLPRDVALGRDDQPDGRLVPGAAVVDRAASVGWAAAGRRATTSPAPTARAA